MKYIFQLKFNAFDVCSVVILSRLAYDAAWDAKRLLLILLATVAAAAISTIGARYFK